MIILNVKHNKANVRQDNNECGAVSGACEGSTYTCLRDTPVSSQYVFWAQRIEIRIEPWTEKQHSGTMQEKQNLEWGRYSQGKSPTHIVRCYVQLNLAFLKHLEQKWRSFLRRLREAILWWTRSSRRWASSSSWTTPRRWTRNPEDSPMSATPWPSIFGRWLPLVGLSSCVSTSSNQISTICQNDDDKDAYIFKMTLVMTRKGVMMFWRALFMIE